MGCWNQSSKNRLSLTRTKYWSDHPERLAEHREKIRQSWERRRAVDNHQCKPASESALEMQLQTRGLTIIEPRIRKLDLWPKAWKELTERSR